MSIEITSFRPADAAAFEALNREWLVRHDLLEAADEPQLTNPQGTILQHGGEIFIARLGDTVVGCCAAIPHGPGEMELAKLAVHADSRGHGVGRRLVMAVVAFARAEGCRTIVLVSSTKLVAALRLYESVGFQHQPLPVNLPYATADVYMSLDLAPAAPAAR